jgi:hypothetical protein
MKTTTNPGPRHRYWICFAGPKLQPPSNGGWVASSSL